MNRIAFFSILMLLCLISNAQELIVGDSTVVKNIKSKTSKIYENKDKTSFYLTNKRLRKIKTFGTNIIANFKNDTINRIVSISMTKNGQLATEWYYWNNKLVYVYESFEFFEESKKKSSWKNFKNFYAWESRYYLVDEKLKYQKHKGKRNPTNSSQINQIIKDGNNIRNYIVNNN